MPIEVECPCGARISVPDHFAGKTGKCKKCERRLEIPFVNAYEANTLELAVASPPGRRKWGYVVAVLVGILIGAMPLLFRQAPRPHVPQPAIVLPRERINSAPSPTSTLTGRFRVEGTNNKPIFAPDMSVMLIPGKVRRKDVGKTLAAIRSRTQNRSIIEAVEKVERLAPDAIIPVQPLCDVIRTTTPRIYDVDAEAVFQAAISDQVWLDFVVASHLHALTADEDGNLTIIEIVPGDYLVYAFFVTGGAYPEWLLPISIGEGTHSEITFTNKNMTRLITRDGR